MGLIDFTKAYSRGEYAHKYYSGRRMWDGLRRSSRRSPCRPEHGDLRNDKPSRPWGKSVYPFSVAPDQRVSPQSWMARIGRTMRARRTTHHGAWRGAFGTPDRYATEGAPGDPGSAHGNAR